MISAQQVQSARQRRASTRTYSFERNGSLWSPVRAAGLQMAMTPALPNLGLTGDVTTWPASSNLVSWHNWYSDRTYDSQLNASGTGPPPNVTFSGTIPLNFGLRVEITTGGARGTAVFRWSGNNGTSWTSGVTTAATVDLGNGVTLNFSVGTYATDNVYLLKVSQWIDQTGNGFHFVTTDANADKYPIPLVTSTGTALKFDGVNDILQCAGTLANDLAGGTNNTWTAFIVATIADITPTSGLGMVLFLGSTLGGRWHYVGFRDSTPDYLCGRRDDAGTDANIAGGTPDTSIHIFEYTFDGTNGTYLIDGTIVAGPSTQSLAALTPNVASIGSSYIGGAEGNPTEISLFEMLTYNAALTAAERSEIRQLLKPGYGIA